MSTKAFDIVTILAFILQAENFLNSFSRRWEIGNCKQAWMLGWLNDFRDQISKITGLEAKISQNHEVLNAFLRSKNIQPMFSPFNEGDIGVASVLDKWVQWTVTAKLATISAKNGLRKPSFIIPPSGVKIFKSARGSLAKLKTKSDDNLWLLLPNEGADEQLNDIEMFALSFQVMREKKIIDERFASVEIPKIDLSVEPDISFLEGMLINDDGGFPWSIVKAFQLFKMRMDETGARVKVASGMRMRMTAYIIKKNLVFNRPFFGWWTQKGMEYLPMAVFYADYDCWKQPAGSLDEL